MFVKGKRRKDVMIDHDHFLRKTSQLKEACHKHSSICFTVYLKGFSVVNQQTLFRPKGIYLHIIAKKDGKTET